MIDGIADAIEDGLGSLPVPVFLGADERVGISEVQPVVLQGKFLRGDTPKGDREQVDVGAVTRIRCVSVGYETKAGEITETYEVWVSGVRGGWVRVWAARTSSPMRLAAIGSDAIVSVFTEQHLNTQRG